MGNLDSLLIPSASIVTLLVVYCVSAYTTLGKKLHAPSSGEKKLSQFLFRHGRRIVYSGAICFATGLYTYVAYTVPTISYGLSVLVRYYALTALFLLYAVLLPGLILSFFPRFYWNGVLVHVRRSLGVSVFFFASLHGGLAFFHNLAGHVSSVFLLSARNQYAIILSVSAFAIFSLLALTSFDIAEKTLGTTWWKRLHRFVYAAALFVVFHAFLIGSNFSDPTAALPFIVNYLSLTYIILETAATIKRRMLTDPVIFSLHNIRLWLVLGVFLCIGFGGSVYGVNAKYDPHAAHRKGYSKNYSMSVTANPVHVRPGEPVRLTFRITDKRTGMPLLRYQTVMEKLMHVVVLRSDLLSYDHIHPEYDGNGTFTISHIFPTDGTYSLFSEYSPPDFYENLSVGVIHVGNPSGAQTAHLRPDTLTKVFGSTQITLSFKKPLKINDTVDFTYALSDAVTGKPITDIEPYLSAFGHMSAASEDLKTYAHVHPIQVPISSEDRGGPVVQFSTFFPKPGNYKLFTQFKRNGEVFVTDFVVSVQ